MDLGEFFNNPKESHIVSNSPFSTLKLQKKVDERHLKNEQNIPRYERFNAFVDETALFVRPLLVVVFHLIVYFAHASGRIRQLFNGGNEESERQLHVIVGTTGRHCVDRHREVECYCGSRFGW